MAYFTGKVTNEGVYRLDECVYVISGKILYFKPGLYDIGNPDDMKELMNFVNILYTNDGPERRYGKKSICILHDLSENGERCFTPDILVPDSFPDEHKVHMEKAIGDLYGI